MSRFLQEHAPSLLLNFAVAEFKESLYLHRISSSSLQTPKSWYTPTILTAHMLVQGSHWKWPLCDSDCLQQIAAIWSRQLAWENFTGLSAGSIVSYLRYQTLSPEHSPSGKATPRQILALSWLKSPTVPWLPTRPDSICLKVFLFQEKSAPDTN